MNCVGRIEKRLIKNSLCHPELAAPLVADEKAAYKGGCSQSISGSSRRQKCSTICTQKSNVGLKAQPTFIPVSSRRRSIVMPCLRHHSPRKVAFTLAEVLITLGIIGVVAAMTIPTLLQNRVNTEVESKLKKVYSVMNQAILMSEQDNGPKEYWPSACGAGQNITCEEYYNKYILKYLKGISYKTFYLNTDFNIVIFFTDGSALIGKNIYDYFFYPNARNFELNSFGEYADNGMLYRNELGRTFFSFRFLPGENIPSEKFHFKRGFEPYKHGLEEFTFNSVKNGSYACTESVPVPAYCTALIQLNGWKIPKDYPFKVR